MPHSSRRSSAAGRTAAFWDDPQAGAGWYACDPRRLRDAGRWPRRLAWCMAVVMAAWLVATSGYVILRDTPAPAPAPDKGDLRAAYEQRISRLRSEIEDINGRLMLNQDAFNAELAALRRRQAQLEAHQRALDELMDAASHPAIQGVVEPAGETTGDSRRDRGADTGASREIRLVFAPREGDAPTFVRPAGDGGARARNAAEHALLRLAESQDRLEAAQNATLALLEARAAVSTRAVEDIVAELGFELDQIGRQPAGAGAAATSVGGPFVPVVLDAGDPRSRFDQRIAGVQRRLALSASLYEGLMTLPVRRPLDEDVEVTSRFGPRRDPFLGSMAMHAGIDFRAPPGTPVLATADGVVTAAGRNGGYGRMIDILHSNGITTRYAHLSRIDVSEGARISAGDLIGRVGSSGRSTGPHLHYETRINGEPVDAERFIRAGDRFFEKLLN